jgi:hypothetical protein
MIDYVTNVVGTSRRKCKCRVGQKTWLSHWERGTRLIRPLKCVARGCRHRVQVGAHVRHTRSDQRIIWIVPFCQYHNKRAHNHHIPLKDGVTLCGAAKTDCV